MTEDRRWRSNGIAERPLLGRFTTAVTPKVRTAPAATQVPSRATGAPGEVRVGQVLDGIGDVIALHDRRQPQSGANIDHIAVTPGGVWVIDSKVYQDQPIEYRDAGGLLRRDPRLYVAGRNKTRLVHTTRWQVEAVARSTADLLGPTVVRPLVCFVGSTWGWRPTTFSVRGVGVCWPLALPEILRRPGPFDSEARRRIAGVLAAALPAAAA